MIRMDMLGPAQFWYEERVLEFRPLERLIHMVLLVCGGTMTTTALAEAVWGSPTEKSVVTLRGCLSKARAKVTAAGGTPEQLSRTRRMSSGQTVVSLTHGWDIDTDRFRQHATAASAAYQSGQFGEARAQVNAVLELWYDDPLPDAAGRPFATQYIKDLRGIHRAAFLTGLKAGICLGGHREVIAELEHLTSSRPDEGEAWMLLATALYRSYRELEAAEVCKRAITVRTGNGIEAHRLQELQRALLTEAAPHMGPLGW
jgi:DNA-binding SARP family transcriptional activator